MTLATGAVDVPSAGDFGILSSYYKLTNIANLCIGCIPPFAFHLSFCLQVAAGRHITLCLEA